MANPLFSMFGNSFTVGNNQNGDLFNRFQEFKNNFQGDPKQKVQELLNSGQMTQDQFNQLSSMARVFQNMIR